MAQASLAFSDKYALHKLIKLRKRRILTASNRLRLRYVALNVALVATAAVYLVPDITKVSLKPSMGGFQLSVSEKLASKESSRAMTAESQIAAAPTQLELFSEEELANLERPKPKQAIEKTTTEKLTQKPAAKQAHALTPTPSEKPLPEKQQSQEQPARKISAAPAQVPATASHELTPAPFEDEPFFTEEFAAADAEDQKLSGAQALLAMFTKAGDPSRESTQEEAGAEEKALASIEPASGNLLPTQNSASAFQDPPEMRDQIKKMEIGSGDTLGVLLEQAGLSATDVHYAIKAMSKHYNPRYMKPGQEVKVVFDAPYQGGAFKEFAVKISPIKELTVSKKLDGTFSASVEKEQLVKRTNSVTTNIETSLYGSALKAGIPQNVVGELIRLYSWSVDFQRDIRAGDKIEIFYETMENEDGSYKEFGNVIYANLGVGGRDKPIYRYKMKNGDIDYFEPDGRSIRKTLMRTPIDGARLSSGFGMRKHPVLGYTKMHKGTDFAAPTGTPIYAAGDGVIESIGRNGGYGNYIRIRHNSKLKTAYAHMHKYKKGLAKGSRVKQGQVIGYVGTTGRSTGPHLHYEVHVNGVQKNPRSVNVPTGEELEGTEYANFKAHMSAIKQRYVAHRFGDGDEKVKVAQNKAATNPDSDL